MSFSFTTVINTSINLLYKSDYIYFSMQEELVHYLI